MNPAGGLHIAGASSSGASAEPVEAPSAQLAALAQQLGRLELRRAELQACIGKVQEARLAGARGAGGTRSRNEINNLQDHVGRGRSKLHQWLARRDAQVDQLDRTDRSLASCERSLAALSLAPPRRAPAVSAKTPAPAPSGQAAEPLDSAPISAPEAAARQRMQQLKMQREALKLEQDRLAKTVVAPARAEVRRLAAEAEEILEPTRYMDRIERSVRSNLKSYLLQASLPPIKVPPSGNADTRYERYLEHFTEAGTGARRLKEESLAAGNTAFTAFSALYGSMVPNVYVYGLLWRVLQGYMADVRHGSSDDMLRKQMEPITAALCGGAGDALEAVVRRQVKLGFDSCMFDSAKMASISVRHGGTGARRSLLQSGGAVPLADVVVTAERNETLFHLQAMPGHRKEIIRGAVTQATALVSTLAEEYADAMAEVKQAQGSLDEAQKELRLVVEQGVAVAQEFTTVRQQVNQFADERHRLEAAEANKDAKPPSEAAIPQTETVHTSLLLDPEARGMKLRGDIQGHRGSADTTKQQIADIEEKIRQARAELQRCEDQLETAVAAHARNAAGTRRQFAAQGRELASLRGRIPPLDLEILEARTKLRSHSTSNAMISERAWDRAVDRHLLLDDAALRARAHETGYAGAYDSHAGMALAVAEIHAHVSQRPDLQAVLAARTHDEFDRAITELPHGVSVTDAVFNHGRPVGRGFSHTSSPTEPPTLLTQSSYSLDFEQEGRVAVSHLYPCVGK